jgi:predicted membrane metal-binding protein
MIEDTGVHLKESRIAIGLLATFSAVWFAALGATLWWTAWWAWPIAAMLYNVAYICYDLPNIWKRAVGSWAGDGFMTEDSQDFLSLNVGGDKGSTTRVRRAHHAGETNGEVNIDETSRLVIETQRELVARPN